MKTMVKLLVLFLCLGMISACNTNEKKKEKYNRKIYLTQEDYLEDLSEEAALERREAPATAESGYIFNSQPETQENVYFFDERQQPKVPGQPVASDYKKEKRLWTKPRRYTPDEYYGMQGGGDSSSSSSEESSYSSYSDY
jgi:hypothetical protein